MNKRTSKLFEYPSYPKRLNFSSSINDGKLVSLAHLNYNCKFICKFLIFRMNRIFFKFIYERTFLIHHMSNCVI